MPSVNVLLCGSRAVVVVVSHISIRLTRRRAWRLYDSTVSNVGHFDVFSSWCKSDVDTLYRAAVILMQSDLMEVSLSPCQRAPGRQPVGAVCVCVCVLSYKGNYKMLMTHTGFFIWLFVYNHRIVTRVFL